MLIQIRFKKPTSVKGLHYLAGKTYPAADEKFGAAMIAAGGEPVQAVNVAAGKPVQNEPTKTDADPKSDAGKDPGKGAKGQKHSK